MATKMVRSMSGGWRRTMACGTQRQAGQRSGQAGASSRGGSSPGSAERLRKGSTAIAERLASAAAAASAAATASVPAAGRTPPFMAASAEPRGRSSRKPMAATRARPAARPAARPKRRTRLAGGDADRGREAGQEHAVDVFEPPRQGLQFGAQGGRGRGALVAVLDQQLAEEIVEDRRPVGPFGGDLAGDAVVDRVEDQRRGVAVEEPAAGGRFVEDGAEGEEVGAAVDRFRPRPARATCRPGCRRSSRPGSGPRQRARWAREGFQEGEWARCRRPRGRPQAQRGRSRGSWRGRGG